MIRQNFLCGWETKKKKKLIFIWSHKSFLNIEPGTIFPCDTNSLYNQYKCYKHISKLYNSQTWAEKSKFISFRIYKIRNTGWIHFFISYFSACVKLWGLGVFVIRFYPNGCRWSPVNIPQIHLRRHLTKPITRWKIVKLTSTK